MPIPELRPLTDNYMHVTKTDVTAGDACVRAPCTGRVYQVGFMLGSAATNSGSTAVTVNVFLNNTSMNNGQSSLLVAGSSVGAQVFNVPGAGGACYEGDIIKFTFAAGTTGGGPVQCFAVIRRGT